MIYCHRPFASEQIKYFNLFLMKKLFLELSLPNFWNRNCKKNFLYKALYFFLKFVFWSTQTKNLIFKIKIDWFISKIFVSYFYSNAYNWLLKLSANSTIKLKYVFVQSVWARVQNNDFHHDYFRLLSLWFFE